jgi:hypothetical protein
MPLNEGLKIKKNIRSEDFPASHGWSRVHLSFCGVKDPLNWYICLSEEWQISSNKQYCNILDSRLWFHGFWGTHIIILDCQNARKGLSRVFWLGDPVLASFVSFGHTCHEFLAKHLKGSPQRVWFAFQLTTSMLHRKAVVVKHGFNPSEKFWSIGIIIYMEKKGSKPPTTCGWETLGSALGSWIFSKLDPHCAPGSSEAYCKLAASSWRATQTKSLADRWAIQKDLVNP